MTLLAPLERAARIALERRKLARVAQVPVPDTSALSRTVTAESLAALFAASPALAAEWESVAGELEPLGITARAGGVNPGDRRALYYLFRHLRPAAVLEVGTHIGASTAHIAVALRRTAAEGGPAGVLTTVDVADVNDPVRQPWRGFGAAMAPAELVGRLGMGERVRFVAQRSVDFLAQTGQKFDVIFLDGDHSARTVYREIPAALRALAPGGVILLHDYFPALAPLWPDGKVIPGPKLALARLEAEGAKLDVIPLETLPWPTKQGTSVTSLAVVRRGVV